MTLPQKPGPTPPLTQNAAASAARFVPVSHPQITITSRFWSQRQQRNREDTLPHIYAQCDITGRLAAFQNQWPPELLERRTQGNITHLFWDSDVAKWIEAASASLATHPDTKLEGLLDQLIAQIAAAQQPDGYLNSWFGLVEPARRWSNLRDWHELYNGGHLIEAAIAHFQATGKRTLLDVMCHYADYVGTVFGPAPGQRRGYCGHPEIELALVRLFHLTSERRYLDLARYFIDERGQQPHYFDHEARERGEDPAAFWAGTYAYNQSHRPVREQHEAVGHAVRAAYLYSAMADLAAEDGDTHLLAVCQQLWQQLTTQQMYVIGGIGSSRQNEGFTTAYDLPNERAYAESCAAIALVFWAQRMLEIDLDRRYADVMELALYNAVLSGVSLDGTRFFYENPLASTGSHQRQPWFTCPCCPPNLARLLASLGGYIYAQHENDVVVHLYIQSKAHLNIDGVAVTLEQITNYPWEGTITFQIATAEPVAFTLRLRLPAWCRESHLTLNGEGIELDEAVERGYVRISRTWQSGDTLELQLPMAPERLYAHPAVQADVGHVALRRGPLIYCLEQVDHAVPLHRIVLPTDAPLRATFSADLLDGVVVLETTGLALHDAGWHDTLYRTTPPQSEPCPLRAIPYFAWANRANGPMTVWIRESSGATP
jgi:uncharacterized protein